MTVSRLAHNALQRIQHPIHAEHRAPFAGYNRMPPAEQQGPVIADPNILPNAVQPEALDTHQIANRKNAPKTVDFNLHGKNVKLPEPPKISNDDIISICKQGDDIYRELMAGRSVENTKENAAKLMWYLQAQASNKVSVSAGLAESGPQNFKMGAFSIEDKDHNIENFLNNAGSYSRKSSHLKEFKNAGADYHSRGLDIDSKNIFLPNNRKTILFARMPQKSENTPTGIPGKNMLFIKMEEHGCHRLKDKVSHGVNYIPTLLEQKFGVNKRDDGVDNRERIPADIKKSYSELASGFNSWTGMNINTSNALSTTGGIKTMIEDLALMRDYIKTAISIDSQKIEANKYLEKTTTLYDDLRSRDHSDIRIGNEIIITGPYRIPVSSANVDISNPDLQEKTKKTFIEILSLAGHSEKSGTWIEDPVGYITNRTSLGSDIKRGFKLLSDGVPFTGLEETETEDESKQIEQIKQIKQNALDWISGLIRPTTSPPEKNLTDAQLKKITSAVAACCEQSILIQLGNAMGKLLAADENRVIGFTNDLSPRALPQSLEIKRQYTGGNNQVIVDVTASTSYWGNALFENVKNEAETKMYHAITNDDEHMRGQVTVRVTMALDSDNSEITLTIPEDIHVNGNINFG